MTTSSTMFSLAYFIYWNLNFLAQFTFFTIKCLIVQVTTMITMIYPTITCRSIKIQNKKLPLDYWNSINIMMSHRRQREPGMSASDQQLSWEHTGSNLIVAHHSEAQGWSLVDIPGSGCRVIL